MTSGHDQSSASLAPASGIDVLSEMLRSSSDRRNAVSRGVHTLGVVGAAAKSFRRVVLPSAQHLISLHVVTQGGCWAGLTGAPPSASKPATCWSFRTVTPTTSPTRQRLSAPTATRRRWRLPGHGRRQIAPHRVRRWEWDRQVPVHLRISRLRSAALQSRTVGIAPPALCPSSHLGDGLSHLIAFALNELHELRVAGQVVRLRMAELLFVEVMRRYLETLPSGQTGCLAGLRDPLVARALASLHNAPAQDWTLDALAAQAATSRSVLAERFVHFMGQPPMQYLRELRMQLASRLLTEDGAKVASVAAAVGFESGCLQSRLQEMRRPFTGRMATTTSGMTGASAEGGHFRY